MKYKLPLLLILSFSNLSYCNEKHNKKEVIMRSEREDEIQAKKDKGEELTFDEEIDDPDFEPKEEKKPEPLSLKRRIANYYQLLVAIGYLTIFKLKDCYCYSAERIRRTLGLNIEEKKADIEQTDNDNIDEIDFD